MASKGKTLPVRLIIGMIFGSKELSSSAEKILEKKFGKIDFPSEIMDFSYTSYYKKEMGCNLLRKFISFKRLIKPEKLSDIKIITNKLEKQFSLEGKRRINLDPGYLDLNKFVLASTKDWGHRIYLGKRIYAEATLCFQGDSFRHLEWTYPEYRTKEHIKFFNRMRKQYFEKDLT